MPKIVASYVTLTATDYTCPSAAYGFWTLLIIKDVVVDGPGAISILDYFYLTSGYTTALDNVLLSVIGI